MSSHNVAMDSDKRDQGNPFPPRVLASPASRHSGIGQHDVTIDMLHDDVLLEIFDSYRRLVSWQDKMWKWQKLLHVCRRWRYIVLASPRRLDLQIACDRRTPTRESLDVWPPFPISLSCNPSSGEGTRDNHNIFAALKRRNRMAHIDFPDMTCLEVEHFAAAMDEPFPVLTDLRVGTPEIDQDPVAAALPDSFLAGSAPRLQSFVLEGIAFPALPKFVLSASHFQHLHLLDIPHAGYVPPETMVLFLLPLHNLKGLSIGFTSPESRPFQMSPPTSTHALLPSLTEFQFDGAGEYFVDFIARIDAPMLDTFQMTLTSGFMPNVSQFRQFIDHTDRFKTFTQAQVYLRPWEVHAIFKSPANPGLNIACEVSDWPLASMMGLFGQLLPILSAVEQLELYEEGWDDVDYPIEEEWQEDLDNIRWLELLIPFVSVKSLYVYKYLGVIFAPVLETLNEEGVTVVLPALDNLFFEGFRPSWFEGMITSFLSMRQLSGHPVTV